MVYHSHRMVCVLGGILSLSIGVRLHAYEDGGSGSPSHSPWAWSAGHYAGDEVSADDVVAYWPFEEAERDGIVLAKDHSGGGHVLSEKVRFAECHDIGEGREGTGLRCVNTTNATSALRCISQDFDLSHAFTVEMWIRLPAGAWAATPDKRVYYLFNIDDFCNGGRNTSAAAKLAKVHDGEPYTYRLPFYTNTDGKMRTRWPIVTIPDNVWAHVAFTWDGDAARTYLNGRRVAEWRRKTPALIPAAEIWVGSYYWGGGVKGWIDSVRVLDRAIPFAEPGDDPDVIPKSIRNAAVAQNNAPPSTPRPKDRVKTGDQLERSPVFVSHGCAVAARTSEAPIVDGDLDDPAWQGAETYGSFMHNTGHYLAKDQTEFRVCHDGETLFFGVIAHDRNVKVIRRQVDAATRDGPVYRDDCIELFIDAEGDREDYHHIVANANGAVYDSRRGETVDTTWNGVSAAAGAVGEGHWSVEIAVPFRSLGIRDMSRVSRIGFNVGREQYSRDGHLLAQWISCLNPGGGFHSPDAFGVLYLHRRPSEGPVLDARAVSAVWQDGHLMLTVPTRDGMPFAGRVHAAFSNRELVQWHDAATLVEGATDVRQAIELKPEWTRSFVRLTLLENGDDALPIDRLVTAFDVPELIELDVRKPHYRNNIYADQDIDSIEVDVRSALPHGIELSFGPVGGPSTYARQLESARQPVRVAIPATGLAEGTYRLTATLKTDDDRTVSAKTTVVRNLPGHPNTVRLGEDGVWLRRGERFMPVGWFGLSTRNRGPTIAELVKAQKINAGLTYMYRKGNDRNITRLLDEAAKHDVSVLLYPWSDKGRAERGVLGLSDDVRAEVTDRVNRFKDHPGLLGWYLADEPEIHDVTVSWLVDLYELVRELDPYHPCVVLNDTLPGVTRYAPAADVSMPDPYVIPMKIGPPSNALTKVAAFMDAVVDTGNPAWITPEAFNYGFVDERHALARAVNYAEQRCIAFLAMVHGARGYLYFALHHALPEPDLRIGMPHIIRELGLVSDILVSPGKDLAVKAPGPVRAFAREAEAGFLLVAVNPSAADVGEITLACGTMPQRLTVASEDRETAAVDGTIRDRFGPYAVHVYTSLPNVHALDSIDEITADIAAYKRQLAEDNADNLAFAGNGATVKAATFTRSIYLNDGTVNHPNWQFAPKPGEPAWAEIHFPEPKRISRIVLDATPFHYFSMRSEDVTASVRVGGRWEVVGHVDGNQDTVLAFGFDPVETEAIRLECTKARLALWAEIRAYGP